jgi:hypothetical protein
MGVLRMVADRLGVDDEPEHLPSDEADVHRLGEFIVKVERFDTPLVAREALALPALRARGFVELPDVILTHDDFDHPTAFTVMRAAPGGPLVDLSPDRRIDVVERVADVLRRLAVVDWRSVPGAWSPADKQSSYRAWMTRWIGGDDDALVVLDQRPDGFGGWQFAQLLADEHGALTMIDWGAVGAHWPVSDVVTTLASLDEVDPALRRVFLDAYGPVDADEMAAWERYWALL